MKTKTIGHKQKPVYAPVSGKTGVPKSTAYPNGDKEAARSGAAKTPKTVGGRKA